MSRYDRGTYNDNIRKSLMKDIKQSLDNHAWIGLQSQNLGIGTESDKLTSFDDFSFRHIEPVAARRMYANSDVLQNIIDIPPLDATREGFTLTSDADDMGASKIMMERLEELDVLDALRCHLENTGLYSRGSMFFPIIREDFSDKIEKGDKLSINSIKRVEAINILTEDDFEFFINNADPFSASYLRPETAWIRGIPVHPTRYRWDVHKFFPQENVGVSKLNKVLLATLALRVSNWSLATVMLEVQNKVLKVENLDDYASQDDSTPDFKTSNITVREAVINKVKRWMTSAKMIVIDKNDEYTREMYSATGVKEATDFFWEYLSAVTGMPQSAIKGQAQGTISSADVDALRYVEKVRTELQIKEMKPIIKWLIRILKNEKTGLFQRKFGAQADAIQFEIEFNKIWQPDAVEASSIKFKDSQRGQVDIATGVRDPEQVRRENYPELEEEPLPEIPEQPEMRDLPGLQSAQQTLFNGPS